MGDARRDLGAVFVGGALGALARVALIEAFPVDPGSWPWATLVANLLGAFALGLSVGALQAGRIGGRRAALLGPGLCGALTTFSAMQLELFQMLELGQVLMAAGYATVSLAAGLALESIGRASLRRRVAPR